MMMRLVKKERNRERKMGKERKGKERRSENVKVG